MFPKVDPSKFPEMLNAITENVRDSYAGMVFIDDPEDLASWGFTKEQLDELDSFAQKYGLTDVLEINEWNPDSKPDYILSAFSGLVDKIDDLQGRIRPKADDVSIENFIYLNQIKAGVPEPDQLAHAEENDHIFGLISKFAEGQDTAFVVQKVNFYNHESKEARTIPVNPFAASKANKAAREAFFERKDAEREQGKSLGAKAASARGASEKLDGQSQAAPAKDNLEH